MESLVLFLAYFLELMEDEHFICHASVGSEATLALGRFSLVMVGTGLLSRTVPSTLSAMGSRVIPNNWSSQTFHLCSCIGL